MSTRRIGLYGGTRLTPSVGSFVEELARRLLVETDLTLVTGGFHFHVDAPAALSTDFAALTGATRFADHAHVPLDQRFEVWIPERELDRPGVTRFRAGTVQVVRDASAQARRFKLVSNVDVLITVAGETQTAMVLDLALELDKPVLPLPFTGGDSERYWRRADLQALLRRAFGFDDDFAKRLSAFVPERASEAERDVLVAAIVERANEAVRRDCLVLMPFDHEQSRPTFEALVRWIDAAGFSVRRLDRAAHGNNVFAEFLRQLEACDAVVADVTDANPNVLYELGHAHARGVQPLLFSRRRTDADDPHLPFYLKPYPVEAFDSGSEFAERLMRFLAQRRRRAEQPLSPGGR